VRPTLDEIVLKDNGPVARLTIDTNLTQFASIQEAYR
jgi:hypothetical protein